MRKALAVACLLLFHQANGAQAETRRSEERYGASGADNKSPCL
jgi:hypothetical protein